MGEVAYGFEYGLNAAASDFDGEKKYLRITDIDDQTREFRTDDLSSPDINNPIDDKYLLKEGDILFARTGASVGKTYLYKASDGKTYYAGFLIRAHVSDEADAGFIFQSTLTERYKQFVLLTSQRSGQPGINAQEYADLLLPLPSLSEQRRIGAFFDRLDSLITLHQRKYDKLCVLKKSMLDKMFPKGGSLYPEIRFAGFTDPWEQRKLGEVANVCSGRDYKHLAEGPIPVYGTGGYMTSVSKALSYDEDAIGIGRKGTIDKPYRLQAPFWTVDTLFYAIPEASSDINFLLCSFLNVDWKSKDESTGLPSLSKRAINETEVLVPDNGEQRRIGAFFDRLDSLITLHQRKLELLRNIKKSMLDKMFV